MSLKIAVKNDLTFDLSNTNVPWKDVMPESRPGCHVIYDFGAQEWHLMICPSTNVIQCRVRGMGGPFDGTAKELPLRPGTIILDDLSEVGFDPNNARVRAFRTPKFQAFLDKYGIYALWRINLSGRTLYATDKLTEKNGVKIHQMTTCVYTDGELVVDASTGDVDVGNSIWVLERRVDFDENGSVLDAGYILYTRVRSLERLEKSFAENGILPV